MAHSDDAISFETRTDDTEIRGDTQARMKNGRWARNRGKREDKATVDGATDDAMDHAPADVQESDAHGH
eukprot:gene37889-46027_t